MANQERSDDLPQKGEFWISKAAGLEGNVLCINEVDPIDSIVDPGLVLYTRYNMDGKKLSFSSGLTIRELVKHYRKMQGPLLSFFLLNKENHEETY